MKFLLNSLFIIILSFAPLEVLASGGGLGDIDDGDLTNTADDTETTYEMVCNIRKMFCSGTAVAIMSFAIFAVGILMFQGKLRWGYVMVLMTGMVIFIGANQLTKIMMDAPNNLPVARACEC